MLKQITETKDPILYSREILSCAPNLHTIVEVQYDPYVFHHAAASGDVQTYQIRTAPTSTIAPGVVMASSPALPTQPAEEAARKREVRLMKNRHVHLDHFFIPNSSAQK